MLLYYIIKYVVINFNKFQDLRLNPYSVDTQYVFKLSLKILSPFFFFKVII